MIEFLIAVVLVIFVLYLASTLVSDPGQRKIITAVVILAFLLWVLSFLGYLPFPGK